ncbi:MAG: ATP-dependent DNA helicase RecG [Chromatiales bacterium]|jgi:ATP-dependent DNA helicase RecG|nr:ATP-dependent DNA helicase RecG [Chromatiales bacterium]MDX9768411.1 ATP-dependent DNA helicase RecG [Ectothiorhodospiraceae bacterium]
MPPDPLLSEPLTRLRGVGPALAGRLERIGLATVGDLLFHLPLRYQDRTRLVPLGALRPGDEALVEGEIEHAEVQLRGRRALLVRVADGTGAITLRFFHFNATQREGLTRGTRLRLFGEARLGPLGIEMIHPEYQRLTAAGEPVQAHLTAFYPATEGVSQATLRRLSDTALARLDQLQGGLPDEVCSEYGLMPLADALCYVHRPPPDADLALLADGRHPCQRRLALEELVAHQLSLLRLRARTATLPAPALDVAGDLYRRLCANLSFPLTRAQQRVIGEIADDLRRAHPMLRLVQGDVGSGKTLVAVAACLYAVEAGFQAAIMAPTEILAEQHARNVSTLLEPLGIAVAWLSGRQTAKPRREALHHIERGTARVVVGTHALFQEDVRFDDLALVVIDEQHRFGVHQRLALREKGARDGRHPHQLIMTATPIPRTLAMTAYADLDYSVIDELPPGRTPVKTVALPESRRGEVVEGIHRVCREGRQAYWVCTLIEESEALQCQAAEDSHAALAAALPDLNIALVHGRMKPKEKEAVMAAFKAGAVNLLVATTVIEVGVDVPNASLMVIENAERLGLAQLHQLRGRVGRGAAESSCVLLYRPPLTDTARRRLDALRATTDGFEIARIDLELRGPGEVLGTRQTGDMQFRIADLVRDQDLLPQVQAIAGRVGAAHPEHAESLIARWIGAGLRYGQVG